MKILRNGKIVLLSIIVLFFLGCGSDKLTRGKAEKLIRAAYQFPYDEIKPFEIEYRHLGYDIRSSTMEGLRKEGLLTFTEISAMGFSVIGELTESGKQYAITDKYSPTNEFGEKDHYRKQINVRLAKLDFGEITGIVESKESNSAIVNYTVIRKGITPFGRITNDLKEGVVNASASFTKYDDGWRLNSVAIQTNQDLSQSEIRKPPKEDSKKIEIQELSKNQTEAVSTEIKEAKEILSKTEEGVHYMSQRDSLESLYKFTLDKYDSVAVANNDLSGKLSGKQSEIARLKGEIGSILKNKNATASELARAKTLIEELNSRISALIRVRE